MEEDELYINLHDKLLNPTTLTAKEVAILIGCSLRDVWENISLINSILKLTEDEIKGQLG